MSFRHPLAGRTITRMNGAGNKILVLDLRGSAVTPSPQDARAIHRDPRLDYDQMMVLTDPRRRERRPMSRIYNNDGTLAGACGNGTRCVADRLSRELGADALEVETEAGVIACERLGPWSYRVDMGAPRLGWRDIPLARAVEDTRRVSLAWPDGDPLAALGPARRSTWAIRMRSSSSPTSKRRRRRMGREDRSPSDVSREGQCHLRRDQRARRGDGACLGARRRADARLRLGRLRDPRLRSASRSHGAQRHGAPAGRRARHRMARRGRPCADDGPGRFEGEFVLDDALFEAAL